MGVSCAVGVHHRRERHRLHHSAFALFVLIEVLHDEHEDPMRVNKVALLIHEAYSVGVAIGGNANIGLLCFYRAHQCTQAFGDRFGMINLPKARIMPPMDLEDVG